ncbi:MAG: hypothetical protein GXO40_04200 [Epsilonproteobacteria bacterium]|nr:hypothetical protein [Campylobacterota bacterium]
MRKSIATLLIGSVGLFAAQTQNTPTNINVVLKQNNPQPVTQRSVVGIIPNSPILKKSPIINVTGVGEGVPPVNTVSPAQARALARRAAIADAYRSLAEKMYGIRLSAKDRIRDLITQRTEVRTEVFGIIKGATIDDETWKDGLYTVVLKVKLDACRWSKYLTAPSLYRCR